jgi:large subunit ribosomal protein L30
MRTIVRTLALRKLRDKRVMPDNGAIRGMIKKVSHLVTFKEIEE